MYSFHPAIGTNPVGKKATLQNKNARWEIYGFHGGGDSSSWSFGL